MTERPHAGKNQATTSPMRMLGCLFLLTVAIYGQNLGHDFIEFDDPAYVYENPHVNGGLTWAGVKWAFTGVHVGNWHPLTSLAHMVDVSIFGLHPAGHHAVSVLLHGLNGMLLFWVLRGLTGATWPAFLTAALFVVHPLHVESVAWVSIKKDLLSTAFWLLALDAYGRYVRGSRKQYALVALFLALGLLSKPMVVTLPLVLCVLDCWPLRRLDGKPFLQTAWRLGLEKVPLLALSLISGLLTLWAQRSDGAVRGLSKISLEGRVENALHTGVMYLWQTIWPVGLAPYYPHPGDSLSTGLVVACAAGLAGITLATLLLYRRAPWLLTGWAWYGITLLPVIGIITVGDQARADRYTYLPLVGIFMLLSWSLAGLTARSSRKGLMRRCIAVGLLVPLGGLAFVQAARWQNSETLFSHALAAVEDNAMAAVVVASARVGEGRYQEAVDLLVPLLEEQGNTRNLNNTLGLAYAGLGRYEEALAAYGRELAFAPDHAAALSNSGNAYASQGNLAEAEQYYRRALEADPDYADGYANLGVLGVMLGRNAEAEPLLEKATELAPGDALNWVNLGAVQEALGKHDAAIASCRKAIAQDPNHEKVQALRAALGI